MGRDIKEEKEEVRSHQHHRARPTHTGERHEGVGVGGGGSVLGGKVSLGRAP